jgi:hypothetical protein
LLGCQAFLWRSHCPYGHACRDYLAGARSPWIDAAWSNHPMWMVSSSHYPYPGAWKHLRWLALPWWRGFESSGWIVLFMRVEGEKPLSPDLKGFGVQCLGTFWAEDTRCLLLCPVEWGPTQCGPFDARQPQPSLSAWEAPGPRMVWFTLKFSSF